MLGGGAEAGLARIEMLKASSSEAPNAPRIEMPKTSRGEGNGEGVSPSAADWGVWGRVVSSPSGVRAGAPAKKNEFWCIMRLKEPI